MAKIEKKPKSYQIDMVNGPLASKILFFALPLMLSSLLQLLFNAADVVVVGRFAGSEALAAVGSTGSLVNLLVNLFMGLSIGTNVVVAKDLGAGRTEEASRSIHTSIALSLISGVVLTVLGVTLCRQLLGLMQSPANVIDLSTLYLRIYFCGMPANMLYNFGAAILRAQGDTRRPLYFLTAAGIINVCLNLFFVIILEMSVAGVALATIIAQYISATLVLITLTREQGPLRLNLKNLRLDPAVVARIARVGLPAGMSSIVFSLSNVVIQSAINSFDSTAIIAGNSTGSNIDGFLYVSMNCFYQAAMTFTSQNYSAAKTKRVDRTLAICLLFGGITGLIAGNLVYLFGEQLASLYAPGQPEVIAATVSRMRITSTVYFLCGIMEIPTGTLRGLGYSIAPMLVSMIGACGSRLLWIATIFQFNKTPEMLYLSYPVSWAITACVHLTVFFLVRKHTYAKAQHLQALL